MNPMFCWSQEVIGYPISPWDRRTTARLRGERIGASLIMTGIQAVLEGTRIIASGVSHPGSGRDRLALLSYGS